MRLEWSEEAAEDLETILLLFAMELAGGFENI